MSAIDVSSFLSRLVVHYGEPKFDVPDDATRKRAHEAWLRDMVRNLKDYSNAALNSAAEIILTTRKRRDFPLLSECKEACYEAERALKAQAPRMNLGERSNNFPAWSDSRLRFADDCLQTALARRAAKEGWILAYWNFCRDNMRAPEKEFEIANCIAHAKGFDKAYANCVRGECGELSGPLAKLGASMLQRREELRSKVLG